eukprot:266236-Hanusia_phi.AAC.7
MSDEDPNKQIPRIFVGGMAHGRDPQKPVTEEMIRMVFSKFGEIVGIKTVTFGKGMKDFVFIDYKDHESCQQAIETMHQKPFDEDSSGPMKVELEVCGCPDVNEHSCRCSMPNPDESVALTQGGSNGAPAPLGVVEISCDAPPLPWSVLECRRDFPKTVHDIMTTFLQNVSGWTGPGPGPGPGLDVSNPATITIAHSAVDLVLPDLHRPTTIGTWIVATTSITLRIATEEIMDTTVTCLEIQPCGTRAT